MTNVYLGGMEVKGALSQDTDRDITFDTTHGVVPGSACTHFWTVGGAPTAVATGTDTALAANKVWFTELFIPHNCTLTGLSWLVGSVGGTDKVYLALHDSEGAVLATTAVAGTTAGTAAQIQSIAFTAPYAVKGPGLYYVSLTGNGTTAKLRTYLIPGSKFIAGQDDQTFSSGPAAITPGTTFTASQGPIMCTY